MVASRIIRVTLLAAAVAAAAVVSAPVGAARTAVCGAGMGTQTVKTKSYVLVLHVGAQEHMYTMAQVKKNHPKSGEVMVGGTMMNMGMHMSMSTRHLEVHICSRASGAVLMHAKPTITLTDLTAKGKPQMVPVAIMYGIAEGPSDTHYGNNVTMPAGHLFKVVVRLTGQQATFRVRSGKM